MSDIFLHYFRISYLSHDAKSEDWTCFSLFTIKGYFSKIIIQGVWFLQHMFHNISYIMCMSWCGMTISWLFHDSRLNFFYKIVIWGHAQGFFCGFHKFPAWIWQIMNKYNVELRHKYLRGGGGVIYSRIKANISEGVVVGVEKSPTSRKYYLAIICQLVKSGNFGMLNITQNHSHYPKEVVYLAIHIEQSH